MHNNKQIDLENIGKLDRKIASLRNHIAGNTRFRDFRAIKSFERAINRRAHLLRRVGGAQ